MTLKEITDSQVRISFDGFDGERVTLNIWAPPSGGYVRYGKGNQLCEGLSYSGNTLYWSGEGQLADLVRREYRKMKAANVARDKRLGFF